MTLTVAAIGEQGLLKRVQAFCPSAIVGDDAAVLPVDPGKLLVVTSDVLVDQVHFSDRTTPPEAAGWRAAAANLSDLAAMGAAPLGITVGLALPPETTVDWVERLYQGISECLQQYKSTIVGGDICRSTVRTVAITAFGQVDPNRVIRRSTAQPGDAIVVTGFHGSSRAGLELLLNPEAGRSLDDVDRAALIGVHQRPTPRLDLRLPDGRISGMDSSDGLADAIVQICRMSGVGAEVDRSAIPIHPALRKWVSSDQALEWALYGGEDFELVLCLPQAAAQKIILEMRGSVKVPFSEGAIIGRITSDSNIHLVDSSRQYADTTLNLKQGFQHFKTK